MKKISVVFLIAVLCVTISGCEESSDSKSAADFTYSMNFYQDEFEKEYSHYDKVLTVEQNNETIEIVGTTTSGEIDIKIVCSNGIITENFEYKVDGELGEIIELSEYEGYSWIVKIDIYDDTEGTVSINIY